MSSRPRFERLTAAALIKKMGPAAVVEASMRERGPDCHCVICRSPFAGWCPMSALIGAVKGGWEHCDVVWGDGG